MPDTMKYLTGYPESLLAQARTLLDQGKLGPARTPCAPTRRCTTTWWT